MKGKGIDVADIRLMKRLRKQGRQKGSGATGKGVR
jgi:hypothetical protein